MIADFDVSILLINTFIYLVVLAMTYVFVDRADRIFFFYMITFTYMASTNGAVRIKLLKEAGAD
jgi:hypothetical protein